MNGNLLQGLCRGAVPTPGTASCNKSVETIHHPW